MSNTTQIICILDRSGSMSAQASHVINNFNSFVEEQQSIEGEAELTLAIFDDQYEVIYDKVNLKEVKPLTSKEYFCRGMTAMNDAIGRTVSGLYDKERAIVLIHTDGYENASQEHTYESVKSLIDGKKNKWEFIFAGGDIDAKEIGGNLGIVNTMNVTNDAAGLTRSYAAYSTTTAMYRAGNDISGINLDDIKS